MSAGVSGAPASVTSVAAAIALMAAIDGNPG
jgi:hypothetical protein